MAEYYPPNYIIQEYPSADNFNTTYPQHPPTNDYQMYGYQYQQQNQNQAFFGNNFTPQYYHQQQPCNGLYQYQQQMTPPPSPTQCQKCDFVAETYAQLIEHDSLSHCKSEPKPAIKCNFCSKTLSNLSNLKRHERLHEKQKRQASELLTFITLQADTQTLVLAEPTLPSASESRCYACNKVFSGPCYLRQHNRAHHMGDKPHRCKVCGKKFAEKTGLEEHMRRHQGDKPNKCSYCPKAYNYKCDLFRHMISHTTEGNPHACAICGKAFLRKDHLNKHLITHQKFDEDYATRIR